MNRSVQRLSSKLIHIICIYIYITIASLSWCYNTIEPIFTGSCSRLLFSTPTHNLNPSGPRPGLKRTNKIHVIWFIMNAIFFVLIPLFVAAYENNKVMLRNICMYIWLLHHRVNNRSWFNALQRCIIAIWIHVNNWSGNGPIQWYQAITSTEVDLTVAHMPFIHAEFSRR